MPILELYGIRRAKTRRECEAANGTWRKGVRGVRKASCALPSSRSKKRKSANLAGRAMGEIVKKGTRCGPGKKKLIVRTPTNRHVEMCVDRKTLKR